MKNSYLPNLNIALVTIVMGLCWWGVFVVLLPLTTNFLVNGDMLLPTSDSQALYAIFYFIYKCLSGVLGAFASEFSKVWGRKRIVILGMLAYTSMVLCGLFAVLFMSTWFLYLGCILVSVWTPLMPMMNCLIMDVEKPHGFLKKQPTYTGLWMFGMFISNIVIFCFIVFDLAVIYAVYTCLCVFGTIVSCTLPDLRVEVRSNVEWSSTLPWAAVVELGSAGRYVILLFFQITGVFVYAGLNNAVTANYMIWRYGYSVQELSLYVAGMLVFLAVGTILLNRFLGAEKAYKFLLHPFAILCMSIMMWSSEASPFVMLPFLSAQVAGYSGLTAYFYARSGVSHQVVAGGSFRLADGLANSVGALLGGLNFALFLSSTSLQKNFPGFPYVIIVIFNIGNAIVFCVTEFIVRPQENLAKLNIQS